MGPIVGGVVGGIAGLLLLGGAVVYCLWRRSKRAAPGFVSQSNSNQTESLMRAKYEPVFHGKGSEQAWRQPKMTMYYVRAIRASLACVALTFLSLCSTILRIPMTLGHSQEQLNIWHKRLPHSLRPARLLSTRQ